MSGIEESDQEDLGFYHWLDDIGETPTCEFYYSKVSSLPSAHFQVPSYLSGVQAVASNISQANSIYFFGKSSTKQNYCVRFYLINLRVIQTFGGSLDSIDTVNV